MPTRGVIRFADHIAEDGEAFFDAAAAHEVEGIVAKRADSPYRSGQRSRDWLKIKRPRHADLAVVGYVPGKGARAPLGALMLGWWRDGTLVHAGNVGSGLSETLVRSLLAALEPTRRATAAFEIGADPLPRGAVFVEPRLVAARALHRDHRARHAAPAGARATVRRQGGARRRPPAHRGRGAGARPRRWPRRRQRR